MHDDDEMEDMSREDKIMYKKHELREEQRKKKNGKQNYKNAYDSGENELNSERCITVEAQDRMLSG